MSNDLLTQEILNKLNYLTEKMDELAISSAKTSVTLDNLHEEQRTLENKVKNVETHLEPLNDHVSLVKKVMWVFGVLFTAIIGALVKHYIEK
jgi:hypothetical protein